MNESPLHEHDNIITTPRVNGSLAFEFLLASVNGSTIITLKVKRIVRFCVSTCDCI